MSVEVKQVRVVFVARLTRRKTLIVREVMHVGVHICVVYCGCIADSTLMLQGLLESM